MSFKSTFTLSEVYNKQLSGVWPTAFYDYFEKSPLLIGTNQAAYLDDASTNKWALTPTSVKASNSHPYQPGYYSTYFNGSTDYLNIPVSTALTFGSSTTVSAMTAEAWFYTTTASTDQTVVSQYASGSSGWSIRLFSGVMRVVLTGDSTLITGTTLLAPNTWYHVALSGSVGSWKLFLNGVQEGTTQTGAVTMGDGAVVQIGRLSNVNYFAGYIGGVRILKGTALYTANFIPPTAPLTAITNTSLLTCMDSYFYDRINPSIAISINGTPSIRSFNPFASSIPSTYASYGSAYLNSAGISNTAFTGANFGTAADFTIESWMKWDATTASNQTSYEFNGTTRTIIGRTSTGLRLYLNGTEKGFAYTFVPSVWYHVAIVRSLLSYYVYINGKLATAAFTQAVNYASTTLTIGKNYDSAESAVGLNLSDFRVVNGTAVYGGNFIPPAAPLTAITNTTLLTFQNNKEILNSTFYDSSSVRNLITTAGIPAQGTFSPISANGWSTYFNGSTDHLTVANTASLNLTDGAPDWTIEAWVYCTALSATDQNIINKDGTSGTSYTQYGLAITSTGIIKGTLGTGGGASGGDSDTSYGTAVISLNTWTHIAFVNKAGTIALYVNGNLNYSGAIRGMRSATASLFIGYQNAQPASNRFNGFISDVRIIKGMALYTTNFTPSTTSLTAISGTSILTCQNNIFKDNSFNNSAITPVGTPLIRPFSPYYPSQKTIGTTIDYVGYSNYFTSASSSYLSIASTASLVIGASDFTVECWIYLNAIPTGSPEIIRTGNFHINFRSSGTFAVTTDAAVLVSSATALVTNTWYHIAAVRTAGYITIYINGLGGTPVADTTVFTQGTTGISETPYLNGYISNLRIVNGIAVYTKQFTPPTAPLTAIPGTALLTCQDNIFSDKSLNALTIVRNGSPQISTLTPFTTPTSTQYDIIDNGSIYFNGTSDYLTIPSSLNFAVSTGNYTFEAWIYPISSTGSLFETAGGIQIGYQAATQFGIAQRGVAWKVFTNSLLATPLLNSWNHVAIVRFGTGTNQTVVFVNGVATFGTDAVDYASTAGTATVGATSGGGSNYFTGYISNLRFTKGQARYIAPFTPSTVLNDFPGTTFLLKGNNAGIYDSTGRSNLSTVNDVKLSPTIKKYGNNSMYFDGTGDYISIPANNKELNFGTGDFTVEAWVYLTAQNTYAVILSSGTATYTTNATAFRVDNGTSTITVNPGGGANTATGPAVALNQWNHIAAMRSGTSLRVYVNGVSGTLSTISSALLFQFNDNGSRIGGGSWDGSISNITGYISDLRAIKGVVKYPFTGFTPPPRLGLVP